MSKENFARVVIKGDGLDYRITIRHFWAAQLIGYIAKFVPEKERLHHRPPQIKGKEG